MLNPTIIKKCVLVDDEYCSIEILKNYIEDCPYIEKFICFTSSIDALNYINSNRVDLLITDISMPYLNGFQLINRIEYHLSVIIITGHEYSIKEIFQANITTLLNKPFSLEEFNGAIKKAHYNQILYQLFDFKNQIIDMYNGLSAREKEIVDMIAMNHKNQKIADLLFISVKTVETTKINIYQKLGIESCQSLSIFAYNKSFLMNL